MLQLRDYEFPVFQLLLSLLEQYLMSTKEVKIMLQKKDEFWYKRKKNSGTIEKPWFKIKKNSGTKEDFYH